MIFSVLISVLLLGYFISNIRSTLNDETILPPLNFIKNLIDGFKFILIGFTYSIIGFVLVSMIFLTTFFIKIDTFTTSFDNVSLDSITELATIMIPTLIVTLIVLFLLFLVFSILFSRFAETNSFKNSLNIKKVFNDIKQIGWGKYIFTNCFLTNTWNFSRDYHVI
ncbi:MAG: DUF4013 domain-containing protein [Methanobrevibacter sp.]|nr:DUF4013 domain-containing protein [Candidatus Methanovirga procula]